MSKLIRDQIIPEDVMSPTPGPDAYISTEEAKEEGLASTGSTSAPR